MNYNLNIINTSTDDKLSFVTSQDISEDSQIIYTTDTVSDIVKISNFNQNVTGDISYYTITNSFRTQILGQWSVWQDITDTNLKNTLYKDVIYQIKSDIILQSPNYNLNLDFNPPRLNETILSEFKVSLNNEYVTIPYNYPIGDISVTIGFMNNNDYYICNDIIYHKTNGYWISNKFIRTGVDSYIPVKFNNQILTDSFIDSIITGNVTPYNDYVLENGEYTFSSGLTPMKGDYITINPKYHQMRLNGQETIQISVDTPTVVNPVINMGDISFDIEKYIYVTDSIIRLNNIGDKAILKPKMHMKCFSISGFELDINNFCISYIPDCLSIKFRYSFDSKKLSTATWHNLTVENLSCIQGTPLKMFFIEFMFEKICDNNGYPFIITDLTLKGDIQILENDYLKTNRFGLRQDCSYTDNTNNSGINDCNTSTTYDTGFKSCEDNLWKPYDLTKPIALAEKLTNDISNQFGWSVDYYRLDPNSAGVDVFLHEYGVSDVVDKQSIKVLIPDNKFPEDQIQFNMFDLALFDSFEVHITKKEFHTKFGIQTRPANGDYLFICQINKLFQVEHAQSYRDFANSALYYKVTLTKKNNDKNIDNRTYTSEFDSMIKNNVTENLFGQEVMEQAYDVSNTMLSQNVTTIDDNLETIRYDKDVIISDIEETIISTKKPMIYRSNIMSVDYMLDNISTVISQNYYDLSTSVETTAIEYVTIKPDTCSCCGLSYSLWFNISKYVPNQIYNFFDISDDTNYGMKFYFKDGKFYLNYFNTVYVFEGDSQIKTNTWFGMILNIYNEKAELYIYKRDTSPILKLVLNKVNDIISVDNTKDMDFIVKGSNMKYTNMRLMKKYLDVSNHNKFLMQYNIKNSGDLILADNCVKQIYAKSFKF